MRLPVILVLALVSSAPAASAGPAPVQAVERPREIAKDTCRRATSYQADRSAIHRGAPPQPKKLTELPPAIAYMAVYRVINGCEEPMTVVEYRTGRRQ